MLRPCCFFVLIFLSSCKSLPDQRRASGQFMQFLTERKATRLLASADNSRLMQAIALVHSEQSCIGVLIGAPQTAESPAYILTAGHCLLNFDDVSSSNRIFLDALPRSDRNSVNFSQADFRLGRVVYATMKGRDLAIAEITADDSDALIFRLTERQELEAEDAVLQRPVTLRRMKELGMEPLPWAPLLPAFGDGIRIISAAAGDETNLAFLREHRCRHEGLADVVEGIWHWYELARNNCDDILPGTSGAPVLNADSALFAIVNTSSRDALSQDCYTGQPCELTEQNFQVAAARNYGSLVLELASCFNAHGFFSTAEPRCPLADASGWQLMSQIKTPVNPQLLSAEDRRWNVQYQTRDRLSKGFRFKTGRLPESDCRTATGYSEKLSWSDKRLRDLPLPSGTGLYALCLISAEEFQHNNLEYAAMVVMNIDEQGPRLKPRLAADPLTQEPLMAVRKSCQSLPEGAPLERRKQCAVAVISFEFHPYEIVDFYHGWIDVKAQDCRQLKNEGQGPKADIPVMALPAKLCVWAIDGAGNRSQDAELFLIRAATAREIIEATDAMVDWSFRL